MTPLRRLAVVALTVLLVAPSIARGALEPYDIDVILPISGPGAYVGSTHQKALTALEGVVNKDGGIKGRPVHFIFHDDQTNPQISVQLANQVIAKKPAVVLGSSLGALCKATQPLFTSGPVDYCVSPVIYPEKGGYVFSASASGVDFILASIRFLRGKGLKRIATLNTTDASGQIADNDIANILKLPENRDVTLVASEHFNPSDISAKAQVAKIKSANPQALIVWAPGTPFGTALHAIADDGLEIPVLTTSANMIVNQMKSYAGFTPKNVYFQGLSYVAGVARSKDTKPMQVFTAALKANGIPQDFQSGIAWDPAMIVIDALRHLKPNATAAALHEYLENLNTYVGIAGVYNFRDGNQRGLTVDDVLIMRWNGEKSDFVSASRFGGFPLDRRCSCPNRDRRASMRSRCTLGAAAPGRRKNGNSFRW